ncbi:hypothetical protein IT415_01375 [bacterium]|nr:hypothetical protein [bacterium]
MGPTPKERAERQPDIGAIEAEKNQNAQDLKKIVQAQSEREPQEEVVEKGDAFLSKRTSGAMTILHHLTHLPEKRDDYGGNTSDRAVNALLKTMGVVVAAIGVKAGISADQVPVLAETIVGTTSFGLLATSILQGMLADSETRDLRRLSNQPHATDGESVA